MDEFSNVLHCPVCGFDYNHIGAVYQMTAKDDYYSAGWAGRGPLAAIRLSGECGSKWELCLGEHKGHVSSFTRIVESCSTAMRSITDLIKRV
jgi:hypothetical protein